MALGNHLYETNDLDGIQVTRDELIAELDDGTVTRDLDNLYELGIEESRIQNPRSWGVILPIAGSTDFRVDWGGGADTRLYNTSSTLQPGAVDQKLDACFDTSDSFTLPERASVDRLSGVVCFEPDGTFTASVGDVSGSYVIDKFEIELEIDGATVSAPFGFRQGDSLTIGEGVYIDR